MKQVPGGEVIMHPGPELRSQGTRPEHGSHDVKMGYGGNEVTFRGGPPPGSKEAPIGQHNTMVQEHPGNTVQISRLIESETGVTVPARTEPEGPSEEYKEILSRISLHSRKSLEGIASDLGVQSLDQIKTMSGSDLAELITAKIILLEEERKEVQNNDESKEE